MIVCTNCGNHNEDSDEFCGSCGKFLEWVGERIEAPAPAPEPEVEEEAEPVKVGFVDRVKAAVGIDQEATVGAGVGGAGGSLPAEPEADVDPDAELQRAAEEAAAAETARQEAEAAEAARRAQVAQEEAQARAAAEAEAARAAEEAARAAAEDEARAEAEAERMRQQQADAEAKQREEEAARAAAEAEAAAADAAAQAAAEEQARAEAEADRMRQQQTEAEQQAQREATERATAEAERLRQEQTEKAAALEAAKRAEEAAKAAAEAEAAARAEAEAKARADAEAARAAEEEARRRAEDEARAVAAAQARAREEEEARKRAAALLARPKAPAAPAAAAPSAADPFVGDATATEHGAAPATAMTPAAAAAAAAAHAQKPTAQTHVAQQPSTVKQPPRPDPKITAVEQAIKPGDLVCSQCGSGNDPSRKFCRKCGNSLAAAVTAVKLPWWKRIFGGKKAGGRVSKEAGARDKRRQNAREASFKAQMAMDTVKKGLMILVMLGLVGSFAIPSVRGEVMRRSKDGFSSVQDLFNPQISPVNAIAVASTSAVPTHEANLAADLVVNSFWAEGAEGDGVGQTISFTFAEPTDLTKVLITAGDTDTPENYVNNPRPKELHLVFDTGGSADLKLIDAEFRKSQGFNLKGAKGVTKVDIVISSVYPGRGGSDTGIAEVEFKKKG